MDKKNYLDISCYPWESPAVSFGPRSEDIRTKDDTIPEEKHTLNTGTVIREPIRYRISHILFYILVSTLLK
jgi:hypothetical protein